MRQQEWEDETFSFFYEYICLGGQPKGRVNWFHSNDLAPIQGKLNYPSWLLSEWEKKTNLLPLLLLLPPPSLTLCKPLMQARWFAGPNLCKASKRTLLDSFRWPSVADWLVGCGATRRTRRQKRRRRLSQGRGSRLGLFLLTHLIPETQRIGQ